LEGKRVKRPTIVTMNAIHMKKLKVWVKRATARDSRPRVGEVENLWYTKSTGIV
jgi:hypothetical protein